MKTYSFIFKNNLFFSNLFLNYTIPRYDVDGNLFREFPVYIIYAQSSNKEKIREAIKDQETQKLPLLVIETKDFELAKSRQQNLMENITIQSEFNNESSVVKTGIAVNFKYDVKIFTKYNEDANYLLEKILKDFYPSVSKSFNILPNMGISFDALIKLTDLSSENQDSYFDNDLTRFFQYNLSFEMSSYIFDSVYNQPQTTDLMIYLTEDGTRFNVSENIIEDTEIGKTVKGLQLEPGVNFFTTDVTNKSFEVANRSGRQLPYVFEFNNGKYYSTTEGEERGLTKTGKIAVYSDTKQFASLNIFFEDHFNSADVFEIALDFDEPNYRHSKFINEVISDYAETNEGYLLVKVLDELHRFYPCLTVLEELKWLNLDFQLTSQDLSEVESIHLFGILDTHNRFFEFSFENGKLTLHGNAISDTLDLTQEFNVVLYKDNDSIKLNINNNIIIGIEAFTDFRQIYLNATEEMKVNFIYGY